MSDYRFQQMLINITNYLVGIDMNEIIKTIAEAAKEAGPQGAFFAIGSLAILGMAIIAKSTKS